MSNVDEVIALVLKDSNQDGVDFGGYDLKGVSLNGVSFVDDGIIQLKSGDSLLLFSSQAGG